MDDARFDALARRLGDGTTRRRLAQLLTGLALSAPFAAWPFADAFARKKHKKKKKKCKGKKKCGKKCIPKTSCCTTADCDATQCETCQGGHCVASACCPPCSSGETCLANGSCAIACEPPDGACPSGCSCSFENIEGTNACIPTLVNCADFSQECTSTSECPSGQQCQLTHCGPSGSESIRCFPLCAT